MGLQGQLIFSHNAQVKLSYKILSPNNKEFPFKTKFKSDLGGGGGE